MQFDELIHLMKKIRLHSPGTLRSVLILLGEALDDLFGVDACALDIPSGKTIYVTKWIEGLDRVRLSKALKLQKVHGYRYIVLDTERDGKGEKAGDRAFSILEVPLLKGQHGIGTLSLFKEGERAFGQEVKGSISILSEVFSSMILPFISLDPRSRGESEDESLKLELLEAVGDERMMRLVLLRMLKLSRAEFCAFYTAENRGYFYIMLEGRELSPRIREIREKLKTAYCMFANRQDTKGMLVESVYYKRQENNVTYLLGNSKIESYFLVPVTFDSSVRGLLFFGSVRKDAFGRDDISIFRRLADEGGDRTPLVFKLGGETGILEGVLNSIPFGGALVSNEGRIICANVLFMETLRMNGSIPEMIQEIGRFSPFNLQGVWEEFGVLRRNLVDRELHSVSVPGRVVAVTWVRLENVSEDVGSVVFLKDVTAMREQEEAREDMLATVAHELRTPMTALKNSIEIMLEADCCNNEFRGRERHESPYSSSRFMNIALRTIKRLGMLVDGLIDVSQAGAGGRPLEPVRVNVTEFLEDASFLFLEPMRKKDIDFEINVDESLSKLVFDRDCIEQVIQNLLSNSIKNVPSGGRISISVSPCSEALGNIFPLVPWKYIPTNRFVDMCVMDTGSGIPAEVAERINPSEDLDGVGDRRSSSLGLYIARRLIQRHGGSFLIERGEDYGSAVHLYLPVNPEIGEIVRTVRLVEGALNSMIGRGLAPSIYSIIKETPGRWLEIAGKWNIQPVVKPRREEITDIGVFLWPLGEHYAIALTAEDRFAQSPASLFDGGEMQPLDGDNVGSISIGWAMGPRDGVNYSELIAVSLDRAASGPVTVL